MRYLSFRFDDGFWEGSSKAVDLLGDLKGTFFIVGDRTVGTARNEGNPLLRGRRFGSMSDWKGVISDGHDVQPHGFTHRNLSHLNGEEQRWEIKESLAVVADLHRGPFVFCFPFNSRPVDLDMRAAGLDAAGFTTLPSSDPLLTNDVDTALDLFDLRSWAVRERDLSEILAQLAQVPNGTWTILAFHSLDGEGWEPWASAEFRKLVQFVRDSEFQVCTIKDMVRRLLDEDM